MNFIFGIVIGLATGIISGFGVGGGSLLVLYLTAFAGISQYEAGGVNLLYFIGCAPAALFGHIRSGAIEWRAVLWCGIAGVCTAIPSAMMAAAMDTRLLYRLFGIILLYIGVKELFTKKQS